MPNVFAALPITDVDVYKYAEGDFAAITTKRRMAYAEDGVTAPPAFTLSSSFPFAARGVQLGHMCVMESYLSSGNTKVIGDAMPVLSAVDGTLTLFRLGYAPGQGSCPGGRETALTAIKFYVPSLLAILTSEYAEVWRLLGITSQADIINSTDLNKILILRVLRVLYFESSRQKDDIFWQKAMDLDKQIALEQAQLVLGQYGAETVQSKRPVAGTAPDLPNWRVPRDHGQGDWQNWTGGNWLY